MRKTTMLRASFVAGMVGVAVAAGIYMGSGVGRAGTYPVSGNCANGGCAAASPGYSTSCDSGGCDISTDPQQTTWCNNQNLTCYVIVPVQQTTCQGLCVNGTMHRPCQTLLNKCQSGP